MNNKDVMEWMQLADDDFDSAKLLNEAVRKHYEIICYHCAQSVEKYLKAYLVFLNIVPKKTHDLRFLNDLCIEKDNEFQIVSALCDVLNKFSNDVRYPHKYEVNETDVQFSLNTVEKVRNLKPILDIRNAVNTDK
jgi:HEPN domain-containing protein